jgi:quercetin dioxygenase-like cupin family protein
MAFGATLALAQAACTHSQTNEASTGGAPATPHEPVAQHKPSLMQPFENLKWNPAAPGSPLQVSVLWGNPSEGAYGMYLKMPAGFETGMHFHSHDYYGVLISGQWEHWDAGQKKPTRLSPGSFVMQPGQAHHGDRCVKGADCIVLLVQQDKNDFVPVTKSKTKVTRDKASKMVDYSKVPWTPAAPSSPLETSTIWGNPSEGAHGMYLKLPGGFEAGLHSHTADYHGVLVSGEWEHWDAGQSSPTKLSKGSYVMQPGAAPHGDRCASRESCVILLVQDQKRDYIPYDKADTKSVN